MMKMCIFVIPQLLVWQNLFNRKDMFHFYRMCNYTFTRQDQSEATGTSLFINPKPIISMTQAFIVPQSVTLCHPLSFSLHANNTVVSVSEESTFDCSTVLPEL